VDRMPRNIIVLTGAGLSAESGLATFRDRGGIWQKYDLTTVATPEAFAADPAFVQEFYNLRRREGVTAQPNAAHQALARLEREHKTAHPSASVLIVTQNVDGLHEAAGTKNLIHMHGELAKVWCTACGLRHTWLDDVPVSLECHACGVVGATRPDIVWFGEMPYHMERIMTALITCDLFISIGTSGNVYPAAGFVQEARRSGARTVELNLEPSEGASLFDEAIHGPATKIVPAFVDRLLAG
jgi:NAD-dependent deacetylase